MASVDWTTDLSDVSLPMMGIDQGWFGATVRNGVPTVVVVTCDDVVESLRFRLGQHRVGDGVNDLEPFEPLGAVTGSAISSVPGVDGVVLADVGSLDLEAQRVDAAERNSTDAFVDATYFTAGGPAFGASLPRGEWPDYPLVLDSEHAPPVDINELPADRCD